MSYAGYSGSNVGVNRSDVGINKSDVGYSGSYHMAGTFDDIY